jgi:hypothetical protein
MRTGSDPRSPTTGADRWLGLAALVALAAAGCGDGSPTDLADGQPESIRLNMHAVRLAVGEDTTVIATLHDHHGHVIPNPPNGYQVTWSTSNPSVAIAIDGVVRSIGLGQATVTAAAASLPPASVDVQVVATTLMIDGYEAITLGRLGGTRSNAWAISNAGVIAGWSNADGESAFRWTEADGMTALPGISSSRGINTAGAIVGHNRHPNGSTAYVYADGVRTDLAALEPGSNTIAWAINDAGTIVGISDPVASAVVWHRRDDGSYGAPVDLGYRHRYERPAINERGDIAFTVWGSFSGQHEPVLWEVQPDGSYGDAVFLGRPDGGSYVVRDINDAGLIVGFRWTGSIEMAVLWHPDDYSAPIDLGVGQAWGINAHGQIAGVTGGELPTFGGQPRRAALWVVDASGSVAGPFDMGTPAGFQHAGARAINDHGWITGTAWGPEEIMATLWRPEP